MRRAAKFLTDSLSFLEERLIGELVSLSRADENLPRQPLPLDRWLLASALQKCVRRGMCTEALLVARSLHSIDREYSWRRLRVIALEDIGLGNIEAVARVLAVAGKKQLRGALGDQRLYAANVHSLAVGVKDRTACDLLNWIGCSSEAVGFRTELLESPSRWESLAVDGSAPVWQRLVALQLLAGLSVQLGNSYRALSQADTAAVTRVVELVGPPPSVAYAVLKGKGTESLNLALLFAQVLREAADRRVVVDCEAETQSPSRIGGLIPPSFCMYTRVGLQALRSFLRTDRELRDLLSRVGVANKAKALGLLLFQVESALLDRAEDYAPTVRIEAERAELAQLGLKNDEAAAELRMVLKQHLPSLNEARRIAWETSGIQSA